VPFKIRKKYTHWKFGVLDLLFDIKEYLNEPCYEKDHNGILIKRLACSDCMLELQEQVELYLTTQTID